MDWCKLSAGYYRDAALMRAGEAAEVMFLRGLAYCAEHDTAGVIDSLMLKFLCPTRTQSRADSLVKEGLWRAVPGGYLVRSWDIWQESADQLAERRRRDAERKREKRRASTSADTSADIPQTVQADVPECPGGEIEGELEKETTPVVTDTEHVTPIRPGNAQDQQKRDFWEAMLSACGIDPATVNNLSKRPYQEAARALLQSKASPNEMRRRAKAMAGAYSVPITPTLLAKHWPEFAQKQPTGPTNVDPYPTRTLDPEANERGLAAARAVLAGAKLLKAVNE